MTLNAEWSASDNELMQQAGRGEVEAFAQIYDRHAPAVMAVAQRMLSARGEAQDLLHDVFLEAWQAVREFDPARGSVRTWLLVRVRSRALDRVIRRARESQAHRKLASPEPDPAATVSSKLEQGFAVREALAALDASVRGTLELTYFEGLTAVEIAQRMHVPEGTVKSRLARGLLLLSHVFGAQEGTSP